jgi:hypothetical protein
VADHDEHFTYAENINEAGCTVPSVGIEWKTTRMPVVLDMWEVVARAELPDRAPWSTVMTWNAFQGALVYQGVEYKSKASEFEKVLDLPDRVSVPLTVAVGGATAPLERLRAHGWRVLDGPEATITPEQYQQFIARSRGEFSVAKHVYAATRSGWFSCRSACYLAAGRPVVVQETGFSDAIPTGEGVLAFRTVEEAASAIEEVEGNYAHHASAAAAIAAEYFRSDRVLGNLLDQVTGRRALKGVAR